jgi:FKBP-type peptidyl-prolyl cis-trans isomerase FklB
MKVTVIFATVLTVSIILISCQTNNVSKVKLSSELDTVSYCIGINIGSNLKNIPMDEINYDAFIKGVQDIYNDEELLVDLYEASSKINTYFTKLEALQYQANLEEGEEFLEENKSREDIETLPSGLQYRIIREGTGSVPELTDEVTVHYHGTLIDGTIFDSSVERGEPATFPVNQVIHGWQEILQMMPVGSKWEVYIPANLAYGLRPPQGSPIEPNMVLIFEIELLSIEK